MLLSIARAIVLLLAPASPSSISICLFVDEVLLFWAQPSDRQESARVTRARCRRGDEKGIAEGTKAMEEGARPQAFVL